MIMRSEENFVIKLFDLFTPFSVRLVYLMAAFSRKSYFATVVKFVNFIDIYS